MFISKKKRIAKILAGFTLLGILASVFAFNIIAVDSDITHIPETAVNESELIFLAQWYKIPGISDWIINSSSANSIESDSVYIRQYNKKSDSSAIIQNNYTYYFQFNVRFGTTTDGYTYYDLLNLWLCTDQIPGSGSSLSIRGFDDFVLYFETGHPITTVTVIFRADSETDYTSFNKFCVEYYGSGTDLYRIPGYVIYEYYDIDGNIYNGIVMNQLENIDNQLDNVNNNLVIIDSSIDDMNTNVGNKLQQVQNKIDAQSQQQHQDAEDIKDEIQGLPEALEETNRIKMQHGWGELEDEFSDDTVLDEFDFDAIVSDLQDVWGAFTTTEKYKRIYLPSSGNVPILNTVLWEEQNIDLSGFMNTTPGTILMIASNGAFALLSIIGIIKWIKSFYILLLDRDHDAED